MGSDQVLNPIEQDAMSGRLFSLLPRNRIAPRMLAWIVACGFLATIGMTVIQVMYDYRIGVAEMRHDMDRIEETTRGVIGGAIWNGDTATVKTVLSAIESNPSVLRV